MSGVQSIPPRKNLGVSSTSEPPLKIAAPDITGLGLEAAKAKILDSGFRFDIEYLIDESRPDGLILGQYPPPDTLRRENGKIKILINTKSSSSMPDLIGKTEVEATALLQENQILFNITRVDTPQALYANKIFYQSVPYGTLLARNVAVVNLSLGNYVPATIGSLPSVLGLTYDLALQQMAVAGFNNIRRIFDASNTTEYQTKNNTVKTQFPPGGQTATFTQEIQLTTYAYSGVVVPNLSGLTVSEAQTQITSLGLLYAVGSSVETSNSTLGNKVSSQSPSAGSTVTSGSIITYNYYTYVYVAPPVPPVAVSPGPPYNPPTPPAPPIYVVPAPPVAPVDPPDVPISPDVPPIGPIYVFPIDIPPIDFPIGVSPATGKSIGINTLVRTPEGLVAAKDLRVGDTLISASISTFPTEGFGATDLALAWKNSNPEIDLVETTIARISRKMSSYAVVINNDLFSDTHYIFAKRGGQAQFIKSLDIESSDLIYSYSDSSWVEITTLEKVQVDHEIISIDCEPFDIFFTENMLTHDSHSV
jgi:beta-lactam-binding protein with PASTA domain